MSSKYKVGEDAIAHFVTFAVVGCPPYWLKCLAEVCGAGVPNTMLKFKNVILVGSPLSFSSTGFPPIAGQVVTRVKRWL